MTSTARVEMRPDDRLRSVGESEIPPDPEGLLAAVSSLGYSMQDALADLIDNSIDARAKQVRIRILRDHDRLKSVVIADDGHGMSEAVLDRAMGFGVRPSDGRIRLGKYGLGLKAASFSQCSQLTVLSRTRRGAAAGRLWTSEGIGRGWLCEHVSPTDAASYLDLDWLDGQRTQTIVRWDDLAAFRIPGARTEETIGELFDGLQTHLGLHLHRFIDDGLDITLDTYDLQLRDSAPARAVDALDPFEYPRSGDSGYPKKFTLAIPDVGEIDVEAHIWPTGVRPKNLLLGRGQLAIRQGFYFYRNDRLIQAGGWNGARADAEPHMSLARARIELPPELDDAFGMNVRKAGLQVPEGFAEAVLSATSDGTSFRQYWARAQSVYRRKDKHGPSHAANVVLGSGVPAKLRKQFRKRHGKKSCTEIAFVWKLLPEDMFFELDRERYRIHLNSRYRRAVLNGRPGSASDAPLVKTLLFLRLGPELFVERVWAQREDELEALQDLLVMAAKMQFP